MEPVSRFYWGAEAASGWWEPPRLLYDCELVHIERGRSTVRVGAARYVLEAGAILIIPPATDHESFVREGDTAMRHCIHFDWTRAEVDKEPPLFCMAGEPFLDADVHRVPEPFAGVLPLFRDARALLPIAQDVARLMERMQRRAPEADLFLWPILRFLLAPDTPEEASAAGGGKVRRAVARVRQLIEEEYAQPLGYADFCDVSGLSRNYLCEVFARWMGSPPVSYLNRIRLEHARRLLGESPLQVREVARLVGIADANYFARLFRQEFGLSPSAWLAGQVGENGPAAGPFPG